MEVGVRNTSVNYELVHLNITTVCPEKRETLKILQ